MNSHGPDIPTGLPAQPRPPNPANPVTMSPEPAWPPPWYRWPRSIDRNGLEADERVCDIPFLTPEGNWVTFQALLSRRYPQSFIPGQTADGIGHTIQDLEQAEIKTYLTPLGRIRSTQATLLAFELELAPGSNFLVRTLVLEDIERFRHLGVGIILGRPFIDSFWGLGEWPPQQYMWWSGGGPPQQQVSWPGGGPPQQQVSWPGGEPPQQQVWWPGGLPQQYVQPFLVENDGMPAMPAMDANRIADLYYLRTADWDMGMAGGHIPPQ
jgi:hypothetical protein